MGAFPVYASGGVVAFWERFQAFFRDFPVLFVDYSVTPGGAVSLPFPVSMAR